MVKIKEIQYEIKATLWFDINEDVNIVEYLNHLREIGEAEVVDVKVVEREEY